MYPFESATSLAFRSLHNGVINVRGSVGETPIISGLAIPYGKWARIRTRNELFIERIERGALKETLAYGHQIKCLVDHKSDSFLGDIRSNLTLQDREDGLYFELKADNDKSIQIIDGVRKGFFDKCSFGFNKIDWVDEERAGVIWRTIKELMLFEVSLVNSPAYTQTSARTNNSTAGGDGIRTAMVSSSGDHQFAAFPRRR